MNEYEFNVLPIPKFYSKMKLIKHLSSTAQHYVVKPTWDMASALKKQNPSLSDTMPETDNIVQEKNKRHHFICSSFDSLISFFLNGVKITPIMILCLKRCWAINRLRYSPNQC